MIKKKIDGIPMWLDLKDHGISKRLLLTNGQREPGYQWILKKEASGVAYDVGANIGWYTILLAERCDKVYAWEPDPRSYKLLEKNIKLNNLTNVEVSQNAIVENNRVVNMLLDKRPNLSRMMPLEMPPKGRGVFVHGTIIDGLDESPDFIKMDIEGGEVAAFKGAWNTLMNAESLKLLVEVHPDKYSKENDFAPLLKECLNNGYYFKYVVNAKGKMGEFTSRGYKPVKTFKHYKYRSVFDGTQIPWEQIIKWSTEMPDDGKKVIRSFLLVKDSS